MRILSIRLPIPPEDIRRYESLRGVFCSVIKRYITNIIIRNVTMERMSFPLEIPPNIPKLMPVLTTKSMLKKGRIEIGVDCEVVKRLKMLILVN